MRPIVKLLLVLHQGSGGIVSILQIGDILLANNAGDALTLNTGGDRIKLKG